MNSLEKEQYNRCVANLVEGDEVAHSYWFYGKFGLEVRSERLLAQKTEVGIRVVTPSSSFRTYNPWNIKITAIYKKGSSNATY